MSQACLRRFKILSSTPTRRLRRCCCQRYLQTNALHGEDALAAAEFKAMFERCKPFPHWPEKIAIAYSGGPDSTSLLYLLNRLISMEKDCTDLPKQLLAITIDHGLQSCSSHVSQECARISRSLGIPHRVLSIPWSTPPFPDRPRENEAFEHLARNARYHLLFKAMQEEDVDIITFGHHLDDQVETALLRLYRGSTEVGAGGMRRCRRWGMGFGDRAGELGWAGEEGMTKWIVRPLLSVPKKRLVATCRRQDLTFVQDATNFLPSLTPRNAIRDALTTSNTSDMCMWQKAADSSVSAAERELRQSLTANIQDLVAHLPSGEYATNIPQLNVLQKAVTYLADRVEQSEQEVTSLLKRCARPSPISTLLLSSKDLNHIEDDSIRLGMVLRILRYCSPFPWGTPRAEAGRRKKSLRRTIERLWGHSYRGFLSGGGVQWIPVVFRSGTIKFPGVPSPDDVTGWLAMRQRPPISAHNNDPAFVDITEPLRTALRRKEDLQLLYDCRFAIRLRPQTLPPQMQSFLKQDVSLARVFIIPQSKYCLPAVIWRSRQDEDLVLAKLQSSGTACYPRKGVADSVITIPPDFFTAVWIRSLHADIPWSGFRYDTTPILDYSK